MAIVLSHDPVIMISFFNKSKLETIAVCFFKAQTDLPILAFQIIARLS